MSIVENEFDNFVLRALENVSNDRIVIPKESSYEHQDNASFITMFIHLFKTSRYCSLPEARSKIVTYHIHWPKVARSLTSQVSPPERVSGIWYVPNAEITDFKNLVEKLPQLLPSKRQNLTTAIFFATPSIASWFAPGHEFLQRSINRIYQPVLPENPPTSIVAIIEALPSPNSFDNARKDDPKQPFRGAEGLALCLMPGSESLTPAMISDSELPLIHFRSLTHEGTDHKCHLVSASLQVANTLFVNGSKSTLFRNQWSPVEDANGLKWQSLDTPEILNGLHLPLHRQPRSFLQFNNRLHAITKPRQVISSMGNVVRELQHDDGSAMKASMELENLVPQFLKDNEANFGPGRVEVYALLMPPLAAGEVKRTQQGEDDVQPDSSASGTPSIPDNRTANLLHKALWHGGRLHKVTGGGGGWGKKAGLLSLETAVNFEASSNFEIGMFPSFDKDQNMMTQEKSSTKEAIPQGWSIEFWATFIGPEQDPYQGFHDRQTDDPGNWTLKRWTWNSMKNRFLIGTTDPKDEQTVSKLEHPRVNGEIITIPSAFGMLSPTGVCLSLESWDPHEDEATNSATNNMINQFRVDAPHTIFRTTMQVKVAVKDYSELDEIPAFESSNANKSAALGSIVDDAIRQSRKPFFRKISYQPKPKFEIPLSKQHKASKEETEPRLHIRKYRSRPPKRVWRPT